MDTTVTSANAVPLPIHSIPFLLHSLWVILLDGPVNHHPTHKVKIVISSNFSDYYRKAKLIVMFLITTWAVVKLLALLSNDL